jgi:hypothetical protein
MAVLEARHAALAGPSGPSNRATEVMGRMSAIFRTTRRPRELLPELHPGVVYTDERPLLGGLGTTDAEGYVDAVQGLVDVGVTDIPMEALAVRGDRLALVRMSYTLEQEDGTVVLNPVLQVQELHEDGRLVRQWVFEVEQVEEATAVLDERYAELLPEAHRDAWRMLSRVVAAANSRDLPTLIAAIGPDGGLDDHRPLSWARLDAEDWADIFALTWEASADARYTTISVAATSPSGALIDMLVHGTRDGGPFEVPIVCAVRVTAQGGVRMQTFVPEDRAQAEAAFAALLEGST